MPMFLTAMGMVVVTVMRAAQQEGADEVDRQAKEGDQRGLSERDVDGLVKAQ